MDKFYITVIRVPQDWRSADWEDVEEGMKSSALRALQKSQDEAVWQSIHILGWRSAHFSVTQARYTGRGRKTLNQDVARSASFLEVTFTANKHQPTRRQKQNE